ncbi:MAG: hypothetical protein ACYTEU_05115 [Planctomycetota bacterium]|jgi:hypothetical protein
MSWTAWGVYTVKGENQTPTSQGLEGVTHSKIKVYLGRIERVRMSFRQEKSTI